MSLTDPDGEPIEIEAVIETQLRIATLVTTYGLEFEFREDVPEPHIHAIMGECFRSAFHDAVDNGHIYCEGLAIHRLSRGEAVNHAWTVDEAGFVRDMVWTAADRRSLEGHHGEVAYCGIPLDTRWVARTIMDRGAFGVLPVLALRNGDGIEEALHGKYRQSQVR